jgi:non-heme chloroperoxidase
MRNLDLALSRRSFVHAATGSVALAALPAVAAPVLNPKLSGSATGVHRGSGFVRTKDGAEIFFKDWGPRDAQPIVFHHGWPLSSDD